MLKLKKILIIIFIILISLFLYTKFFNKKEDSDVVISEVIREDLTFKYDFQGQVASKKEILIYSSLQGEVKKVYFRLGDEVKKGDILLEIDESSLSEIKNTITKAKINLDRASKKYKDTLELYNIGHVSKSELDEVKDNLTITKLDYDELLLKTSEISNKIRSSVSGSIIEANVDENLKIDQSKHLYKIVDTENLRIVAEIPNSKIANFKVDDEVIIKSKSLGEDNKITGRINEISKISNKSEKFNDAVTKLNIEIDSNSGLKPGEIVDIEIVFEKLENILVINYVDLIVEDDGEKYVYVVNGDNKIEKRKVITGINNGVKYEIKEGLSEKERIINNLDGRYKEGDSLKEGKK